MVANWRDTALGARLGAVLGHLGVTRHASASGYDGYIEQLSERLYRETLGDGGWAVDAGLLGPAHYRADAQRLVHEIALGGSISDPPSP